MQETYQREMEQLMAIFRRMRLDVHLLHPRDSLQVLDSGLRGVLGMDTEANAAEHVTRQWSRERTIYKVLDPFMCHYIYFRLPDTSAPTAMVIGPYLTVDPTNAMLMEQAERLGLAVQQLQHQVEFYACLPVFQDPSAIMAIVTCFGETLWGSEDSFDIVDVLYEQHAGVHSASASDAPTGQEDILQRMKMMEERYAYENELMEIVSKGLTHRAEGIMSSVSLLNYQRRLPDPLRNMKNYCIICNTLLRKAAQNGGVHPLYLDRMSSDFARKIENSPTTEKANGLIGEMVRSYCRLVRTKTGNRYSAVVQKAIVYVDSNLASDLTLSGIAGMLQISPGYLSTLFHRETGHTLAVHIASQRMKAALHLLKTTRLQVQTIAQSVGFPDPNYFCKQFKRFFGATPLQYRKSQMGASSEG